MAAKVTRRQIASALAASGVLFGQAPAPPEEDLRAAREQIRQNGELLAKVDLPAATEPAVHFKA